jgi:hypothetical protein
MSIKTDSDISLEVKTAIADIAAKKTQADELSDSISSDTQHRVEMQWVKRIETIIYTWNDNCINNANIHEKISKHNKKIFYSINIPAAVIIFVISAIPSDFVNNNGTIFNILLILAGVLSTINAFLNPGEVSARHHNFYNNYNELSVEILSELAKPRAHRQEADVFLQRTMDKYNSLNSRVDT